MEMKFLSCLWLCCEFKPLTLLAGSILRRFDDDSACTLHDEKTMSATEPCPLGILSHRQVYFQASFRVANVVVVLNQHSTILCPQAL